MHDYVMAPVETYDRLQELLMQCYTVEYLLNEYIESICKGTFNLWCLTMGREQKPADIRVFLHPMTAVVKVSRGPNRYLLLNRYHLGLFLPPDDHS